MGSKGTVQLPQQQNTSSSVAPNPVALAAYADLIGRAQGVGSTPYQPYGGQLVQGFGPQQQQAFNEVGGLQGAAQPYIDKGAGLAMAGATAADPTHFGANIGAYESPYTDQVVNATMANINETNAQQQNSVVGDAIAKGAMGGDRVGVAQAELAREQNLSNNQTIAGLRNTGFQNATAELNQGAAAQGQGAYSMGALGNEAQSTGLQGANALLQTGGLQQQLGQANLSTAYQQFLNQQAYPFQNLSWLSGIINGTGPNMGQSSTGSSQGYTSQLAPSPWNAILGAGVAGAGLFAPGRERGGRVGMANGGIPYADFPGAGGVVGYVPPPSPIMGHGGLQAPKAPDLQHPASSQSASQGSPNFGALGQAGRGLSNLYDRSGGLGALFPDNHDYASDLAEGVAPLARGGGVRGYDDGGTVLDDTSGGLGDLIEGRSAEAPRSTRNNNPGNIEDGPFAQGLPGYAGTDGRFARFETPEHGSAAQDHLLQSYGNRGFDTPSKIVGRWAPSAENGGNSTNAYADFVAKRLGVDPNAPLDMNDPQVRTGLRTAMADYEAGTNGQSRALAYDGAAPTGGGLGAIEGATDKSGTGLGTVAEGRSADDGATPQSSDGLGGIMDRLRISPDTRTALIAAGLGMMASPSHWVGQAIGAGGLEGVKAYQTQQKTGIAQQTANQSGENIKSEIATRKGQLTLQNRQQDIVEQKLKALMDAASTTQRSILGGNEGTAPATAPSGQSPNGAPAVPAIGAPRQLGPSAGTPVAGAATSPASGGDNQAPAANTSPQLAPFSDPVHLDRQASLYEAAAAKVAIDPAAQRNYMTQAQQARQTAAAIRASGKGVTVDGRVVPLPGALETASAEEGAKTEGRLKAEAPYDLKEVTPVPGGPSYYQSKADILAQNGQKQSVPVLSSPGAGTPTSGSPPANPAIAKQPAFIATKQEEMAKNEQKMGEAYQVRQVAAERLQTLSDVLSKYQTGKFAEGKAEFVAALRGVGIPVPSSATANPAAFEQFIKNATANVFSQVKDMGGRVLVAEILGLTKANANPEMQPEANKAILGQAVGLLKYEDAYHDAYFNWKRQNPYAFDSSAFDTQWVKGNPVRGFVMDATKDIGARGEQIPAAANRVQGQVYSNSKGQNARWTGSGWQPIAGNP